MSEPSGAYPHPAQIERIIAALTGIISARVLVTDTGRPTEIHVLADNGVHPKQVVRNVESALRAGLGLEVDRRIVSVAQLRPGALDGTLVDGDQPSRPAAATSPAAAVPEPVPAVSEQPRLVFVGHEVVIAADRTATCTVTLRLGDAEFSGRGSGYDTPQGRAEAGARAAVAALDAWRGEASFGLEGVAIVDLPVSRCVLVAARPLVGQHRVTLTGAALLADSPEEAAIMAVLQATNSWRVPG